VTIKAILWDLDGTLADSAALHFQAWRAIMQQYAIPYTYQMFIDGFGRNNAEILTEHFDPADVATIQRVSFEKEVTYRELLTPGALALLPGVLAWLDDFRRLGLAQVIGSSAPMANITAMARALDIDDYFLAMVSGVHLPKGKPDPAVFLRCAAVAGVAPAECLVIEDSIHGIEAAQRAGMRSVAVGAVAGSDALQALLAEKNAMACLALPSLAQIAASDALT
jgi:HAD superfamily hydrolase (TIGR01509 family)